MPPRHAHKPQPNFENTPMDRAFRDDTISAIATLTTTASSLGDRIESIKLDLYDRMDSGFERQEKAFFQMGETLEKIESAFTSHDKMLQRLTDREERNRRIVKWVFSIVGTFVAAFLIKLVIGA